MSKRERYLRWICVIAVVVIGGFAALNLTINDDALDLLPDGAVRGDLQLLQEVGLVDRLFITLRAEETTYPEPEDATAALRLSAQRLGEALAEDGSFTNVLAKLPTTFEQDLLDGLWPVFPVLIDDHDLSRIEESLTEEELRKQISGNFLRLNSPVGIGTKKLIQNDPLGYFPLLLKKLKFLQSEFRVIPNQGFLQSKDGRSMLVLAQSNTSLTDSKNSERIVTLLERMYSQTLEPDVKAEIIGTLPHTLANSRSIKRDLRILLPVASILLILLLAATLRDVRAAVVFGVPFLGAPPAIAITALIFGEISALALGFGIVILGIAVDFSVHLFLALSREPGSRNEILANIRRPVAFATLTTASVLVVLLLSAVPSHRQMATLALGGVLSGVVFAWLLIPTIISSETIKKRQKEAPKIAFTGFYNPLLQKIAYVLWALLLIFGLWSWPHLKYNGDLRVLDAPDAHVVKMEEHFNETWGDKGEQAFVVASAERLDDALTAAGRLFMFLSDKNYSPIQSPAVLLPDTELQRQRIENWEDFWQTRRPDFDKRFLAISSGQGFSDKAFRPFFSWLDQMPMIFGIEHYNGTLFEPLLRGMVHHVLDSTNERPGERYLVLTTVGINEDSLPELLDYAEKDSAVSILANRKWRGEVETLLKTDILLLSLLAASIVVFLVGLQFRNGAAVAAVLAPVLSALAAMSVFCRLSGSELNMMHLIMGIMVIGLSVDYGIFVVCERLGKASSSAAYAVSVCAASSLIGFGVLAFASHPALHSLGITVLVGIGTAWPSALLISPQLVRPGS